MSDLSFNLENSMPWKGPPLQHVLKKRKIPLKNEIDTSRILTPSRLTNINSPTALSTVIPLGKGIDPFPSISKTGDFDSPMFQLQGRRKRIVQVDHDFTVMDPRDDISLVCKGSPIKSASPAPTVAKDSLKDVAINLTTLKERHLKAGLQSAGKAHHTALGVALAKAILSEDGRVDLHRIDSAIDALFATPDHASPYDRQTVRILEKLSSSAELRAGINTIKAPSTTYAPANRLIRTILALDSDASVGDLEARQAALSALFTHLRQGALGSCFATSRAIQTLWNQPERAIADFRTILEDGCISRTVSGVTETFPTLMHVDDKSLGVKMEIDRAGSISVSGGISTPLEEVPGLVAACKAMGCKSISEAMRETTKELFAKLPIGVSSKQIDVKELLLSLARATKKGGASPNSGYKALYYRGRLAYESQTCNALARVWEFTLASMAEAKEGGIHKQWLVESTIRTCARTLPFGSGVPFQASAALCVALRKALTEKIELRYDPNPRRLVPHHDMQPSEGGFVLYEKRPDRPPQQWRRCDTGPAYEKLVGAALRDAFKQVRESDEWKTYRPHLESPLGNLKRYIRSPNFLVDSVVSYDNRNAAFLYPIPAWHMMRHTPWINRSGAMTEQIWRMDLETDTAPKVVRMNPSNAQELVAWCLDAARNVANTHSTVPLMMPIIAEEYHAFNLWVDPSSTHDLYESASSSHDWLSEHFGTLAQDIAHSTATKETRNDLFKFMETHCIPGPMLETFRTEVASFDAKLTVKELRDHLVDIAQRHHPGGVYAKPMLQQWIDTHLARSALSIETRDNLDKQRVIFADTNWAQNMHDRSLCIAPNPGNGKLELWLVNDDGSEPEATSQDFWLNRSWALCDEPGILPPIGASPLTAAHVAEELDLSKVLKGVNT